ncbi:hypothetical protein CPB84DRAFT_1379899 [Gymnopilus junonius]|uniref:Uncharacterized protein n=1 Tax=Gymnopilus junonius TaxID=109634 RepID=A0A9P5NH96_GYMJU|nr:hypothetical protein CPB84DRAFT_1379899 [Gymnopilus junonius]
MTPTTGPSRCTYDAGRVDTPTPSVPSTLSLVTNMSTFKIPASFYTDILLQRKVHLNSAHIYHAAYTPLQVKDGRRIQGSWLSSTPKEPFHRHKTTIRHDPSMASSYKVIKSLRTMGSAKPSSSPPPSWFPNRRWHRLCHRLCYCFCCSHRQHQH